MCTREFLYRPGENRTITLESRPRGGKLNFKEISYVTDCIREIANRKDLPMVNVIEILRRNDAFKLLYKEAHKVERKPAKVIARELVSLI
ncbi:MAG: hypothetical protein SOX26_03755 [Phocaeicola sp.]|nr:hypothetical protein [Phocaeicola sp.]